jgi:hypothetical protein
MTDTISSATTPDSNLAETAKARVSRTFSHTPIDPGYATLRLLNSESVEEAEQLRDAVIAHLKPRNVIEKIFASDFIHNELELRRLRGISAAALSAARPWSVSRLNGYPDDRFIDSALPTGHYAAGIQDLANKGYPLKDIDAYSALTFAPAFDSLDKRAATLELRRNQALTAFEDRRSQQDLADRTIDADVGDAAAIEHQSDV